MKPKPHLTKYTVVMGTKLMRFDTLEEAEAARDRAVERGEAAWIVPPIGTRL
jgi:nitric oxide synthase oxygenase domain/subunit